MGSRILCIEDNPDNYMLLRRVLESVGHQLLHAENGLDGVAMAENEDIDLIILDINLPDIDGYEVARRVRSSKKLSLGLVPIIVISANALKGDVQKAMCAGCDFYMTKPIDIHELTERVKYHLARSAQPA